MWTKNFKTFPAEEDDVEMTGDGEGLGEPSPDECLRGGFWKNQFRYLE